MENDDTKPIRRKSVFLGGGRESLAILILLVIFSRFAPTLKPLLVFVAAGMVIYWYVRAAAYFFGKPGGWIAIAILLLAVSWFGVVQYLAFQRYEDLVAKLRHYDEITIRRVDIFPTSPVEQITFEKRVDDDVVEKIIRMPELAKVSDVYLKAPGITHRGLELLDRLPRLRYVYVGSLAISHQAAEEFQKKHPQCSVIVPSER